MIFIKVYGNTDNLKMIIINLEYKFKFLSSSIPIKNRDYLNKRSTQVGACLKLVTK